MEIYNATSDLPNSELTLLCNEKFYKGTGIPQEFTIYSLPTKLELAQAGSENFDKVMLEKILPEILSPRVDLKKLTEIDYFWICRCLRIQSFGPYITVDRYFCSECGVISGERRVDITKIKINEMPQDIEPFIVIDKYPFYRGEVKLRFPRRSDVLMLKRSAHFKAAGNSENFELLQMGKFCVCLISIGAETFHNLNETYEYVMQNLSMATTTFLMETWREKTNFGLTYRGACVCEECGNEDAFFITGIDDRFFRPSLGDLSAWSEDEASGEKEWGATAGGKLPKNS